jgi:hypothetical protein
MSLEIVKNFICAGKLLEEPGSPVLEAKQSCFKENICNTLK